MVLINNIIEKSYPLLKKNGNNFRQIIHFNIEKTEIIPGQFFMLNYYGCQKPFSVFSYNKINNYIDEIGFIIEQRGECSKKIINAREGDYFGLTGPLGNGFDIKNYENYLLIGGGIGIAPILFLANYLLINKKSISILLGERKEDNIIYNETINNIVNSDKTNLIIYTDDGSIGKKGFVTKDLEKVIKENNFDSVCICGPEIMMNKAIELINDRIKNIQICMERYMKCGLGICGSCVLDNIGLRVCSEGPVFNYGSTLINCKEFGNYHRNSNGIIKEL